MGAEGAVVGAEVTSPQPTMPSPSWHPSQGWEWAWGSLSLNLVLGLSANQSPGAGLLVQGEGVRELGGVEANTLIPTHRSPWVLAGPRGCT